MAIVKHNLAQLLDENTLVFENVPDINGKTVNDDGTPRVWTIRPLTIEREHQIEKARLKNTGYLQRLIATNQQNWKAVEEGRVLTEQEREGLLSEDDDPLATAEQWAPMVAAMVCEPELDADELLENFHGMTLRVIGEEVEAFFREGPQKMKENRAMRRAK